MLDCQQNNTNSRKLMFTYVSFPIVSSLDTFAVEEFVVRWQPVLVYCKCSVLPTVRGGVEATVAAWTVLSSRLKS